ncbi:UNVERIFIED_CONTAM: hypothetical protein Sradi_0372400 [Sesamum radiatum]|uniref:Uncharacterized protein n=1 Tax=Sesamum radiatum TaxID=300843 RepID=A0AAW2W4M7_SESRA
MLKNPGTDSPAAAASIATVKRYAPPNQRNRSLGRRKSGGDRLERANSYVSDGERNPIGATKSNPVADLGEGVGKCSCQRKPLGWAATMSAYNNLPEDSAERPVLYTRKSSSAWGHAILPHLLIQPTAGASTGLQRDFLTELRQAMQNPNPSPNP